MGKNKLQKFSQIANYKNVYQNFDSSDPILINNEQDEVSLKGKWQSQHFNNENPITLELACGGGEYTVALAQKYPDRNFIGVDIKGARIWKGATEALEQNLDNAAFLRTRIELIENFFDQGEVEEIWITFPDPFLRPSKSNRRLTSPPFLKRYANILKPDGKIHLKTDDDTLYEFTLETIQETKCNLIYNNDNIYSEELYIPELEFKTKYEGMHLEKKKTIKYVQFTL